MSSVLPVSPQVGVAGTGRVNAAALDATIGSIVSQLNAIIAALGVIREGRGRLIDNVVTPRQLSPEALENLKEMIELLVALRKQYTRNWDPRMSITTTPTSIDTSDNITFALGQLSPLPEFSAPMLLSGQEGKNYAMTLRLRSVARKAIASPVTTFAANADNRIVSSPSAMTFSREAVGLTWPGGMLSTNSIVNPFIFTVLTSNAGVSGATQFKLPLDATGSYTMMVDWGDGLSDEISVWNAAATTHTYSLAGTYTVKIYGRCSGWVFGNGGDRLKMLSILQWGALDIGNQGGAFQGCANLDILAEDVPDFSNMNTFTVMFEDCTSLTTIPNSKLWKTGTITQLTRMFNNTPLFNADISTWDVSQVLNMFKTFRVSAFNSPLGAWDVRKVTSFTNTFTSNTAFNQDLSTWVTSAATGFSQMFLGATGFKKGNGLASWDVTKLTDASNMFTGCDMNNPNSASNQTNYNAVLNAWALQAVKPNVPFHAGVATKYGIAAAAASRAILTGAPNNWVITDGGGV